MIVFVGLSHLSLCYSASALIKGKKIVILDFEEIIDKYKNKELNIYENGLERIQKKFSKNLSYSSNFELLKKAEMIFLAKDTETNNKNEYKLKNVDKLVRKIEKYKSRVPLVIMNQVPVGYTRKVKWYDSYKYHFIETLIFGNAIERAVYPERIILGKPNLNTKINQKLLNFLKKYNCQIFEMLYEESELNKMFINLILASQVSLTNYMNEICIKNNLNWDTIKSSLQKDRRIGNKSYLSPGLGISGGNIERDLENLSKITIDKKINFPKLFLKFSDFKKDKLLNCLNYNFVLKKHTNVCILGLRYKNDSLSIKNSPSLRYKKYLEKKCNLLINDRKLESMSKKLKINMHDLSYVQKNSDIVILMNDDYTKNEIKNFKKCKLIIDPFKILYNLKFKNTKIVHI